MKWRSALAAAAVAGAASARAGGLKQDGLPVESLELVDQELTGLQAGACWRDTHGRGAGRPIHQCAHGLEQSGLLCYPPCRQGFDGVGPVCWEQCQDGMKDGGVFCFAKRHTHTKKSYGRGVGKPLQCSNDEDQDDWFFGLCYPKCQCPKMQGIGPVCWSKCDGEFPFDGGALCCRSKETCKDDILDMTLKFPLHLAKAVMDRKDIAKEMADVKAIIEDLLGFVLPLCSEMH